MRGVLLVEEGVCNGLWRLDSEEEPSLLLRAPLPVSLAPDSLLSNPLLLDDAESLTLLDDAEEADLNIADVRVLPDESDEVVKPGVLRLNEYLALRSLDD